MLKNQIGMRANLYPMFQEIQRDHVLDTTTGKIKKLAICPGSIIRNNFFKFINIKK